MKLLAFDCTDQACSVALKIEEQLVERHIEEPRQHSKQLLSTIDQLLAEASTELSALDGVAFTKGPGSFTGLRIAVSVAQALGFAHDTPLFPISSLHALAKTANRLLKLPVDTVVCPTFDARMQQLYWATFKIGEGGELDRLEEDRLDSLEEIFEYEFDSNTAYVGPGANHLNSMFGTHNPELQIHARDILELAARKVTQGAGVAAEDAQPAYLRGSDAWKKLDRQGSNS